MVHEWRFAHDGPDTVVARGIGVHAPAAWLDAGGTWCTRIVDDVLGPREREIWATSRKPEARRREWLLGRLAAKEAAREWVRRHHGVHIPVVNFEILPDADGRPVVTGMETIGPPPLVSISHAEGAAIALAGGASLGGIGIDLERHGRVTQPMEAIVFTAAERELLAAFAGEARQEWRARLWSAKEAAAKFTACTVVPTSRALQVTHIDGSTGRVRLQHKNEDVSVTFRVATAQDGPWILATCVSASTARTVRHEGLTR